MAQGVILIGFCQRMPWIFSQKRSVLVGTSLQKTANYICAVTRKKRHQIIWTLQLSRVTLRMHSLKHNNSSSIIEYTIQ